MTDAPDPILAALEAAPVITGEAEPPQPPGPEGDDPHADSDMAADSGRDEPVTADPAIVARCMLLDQNDTDNGRRLLAHFGDHLLYVREIDWHVWDGTHWSPKGGLHGVVRLAQETARRIKLEAHAMEPAPRDRDLIERAEALAGRPDLTEGERAEMKAGEEAAARLARRRKGRRDFAISSGNRARTMNMIAQAEPLISAGPEEIDRDPMRVNLANGTLAFTREKIEDPGSGEEPRYVWRGSCQLVPHDPADRITKLMPHAYDAAATCPEWDAFLLKFMPDEDSRLFLQVAAGCSLIGGPKTQALIFLYGEGQNGKSVFMETLAQMLADYCGRLRPESITGLDNARGDQATPDFARLQGKRFVAIAELPRGAPLKEGLVKTMTGGEPMPVRHLNRGFFDLTPEFIPFMSGNQLPEIGGLDKGIWRRMKFVHWPVQVTEAERKPMPEMVAGFLKEAPGILNWLIAGALRFLEEGLIDPDAVTALTTQHREDLDPVGAFLRDCVFPKPGNEVQARDLYTCFRRYCAANAIREWKEKAFAMALKTKGLKREDGRIRKWLDIGLDMMGIPDLSDMREARD